MTLLRALRLPPDADQPFVVAGVGVWLGIAAGGSAVVAVACLAGAAAVIWRWARPSGPRPRAAVAFVAVVACLVGLAVGLADRAAVRRVHEAPVPDGLVDVVATVRSDVVAERFGEAVVVDVVDFRTADGASPAAAARLVARGAGLDVAPGDTVRARRVEVRSRPGWHRTTPVTGSVRVDELEVVAGAEALHLRAGNAMRDEVVRALGHRGTQAEGLTRGFLIGDTSSLGALEAEELRRAGLTHFVAVSGGNVALFLGGLWLLLVPVPMAPQARAAVGLLALSTFVVMTRWEPSVLRAAGMAALVLVGKILGLPVDPWRALGGGVAVVLVLAPRLAGSAGFHLSVAATAGLLLASHLGAGRRPQWVWRGLAASTSAQLAVLPLLIGYFGTVPLLAPLANVAAAPVVSAATIVSAFGVVSGSALVVDGGVAIADVVLRIARLAARGPQLDAVASVGVLVIGTMIASRRLRPVGVAVAIAVAAIGWTGPPVARVADSVTVLDVGQGDAILIRGSHGGVVAVDTGPDPVVYLEALRRAGVTHIDLLVLTHGDGDHVGGAAGLLERITVDSIWMPRRRPPAPQVAVLLDEAASRGIHATVPAPGARVDMGDVTIEVLAPLRRYDAENDESIVLWVEGPSRTMLLAGDVEAVAQRELPPVRPDVLLVPHHGSATTDVGWLTATAGEVAIISVGANTYGHPAPVVLGALEQVGVRTFITRRDGDVVVSLRGGHVVGDW